MKCPVCGADTGTATAFCPNCGSRLDNSAGIYSPYPAGQPAAGQTQSGPAVYGANPSAFGSGQEQNSGFGRSSVGVEPEPNVTRPAVNVAPGQPAPSPYGSIFEDTAPVVKMGDWLGTLLILMLVPVAVGIIAGLVTSLLPENQLVSSLLGAIAGLSGLILLLWFAFGKRFNPSKRNFFKAYLLLCVIIIVLVIILVVAAVTVFASYFSSLDSMTQLMDALQNMGIDLSSLGL